MNKFLKYKKIIVVFCLVTFLFIPFQKPKPTEAIAIETTTGLFLLCVIMAGCVGYSFTDVNMMDDVGSRIWDGIKDSYGNAFTVDGQQIKVNTTKNLFDDIAKLCKALPQAYVDKTVQGDVIQKSYVANNSGLFLSFFTDLQGKSSGLLTIKNRGSARNIRMKYGLRYGSINVPIAEGQTFDIIYAVSGTKMYYSIAGISDEITPSSSVDLSTVDKMLSKSTFEWNTTAVYEVVSLYGDDTITIPYTEENGKSVSADIPKSYFPSYGGSISVPINKPLTDYTPSVSAPIGKLEDFTVGGDIDIDNKVVDIPSIDVPSTDVGSTPVTGEGLWDTLLSWLSSLFAPLLELLKWIGQLIQQIIDFLKSLINLLLDGIVSLLQYLFLPTVVLSDLFSIPSSSGFISIVDLFNFDNLFSIQPIPYEFHTSILLNDLSGTGNNRTWDIDIKLFENKVVKDNLNLFRNVLSYSLLISVIYFIVYHFLPKRDMD